MENLDDYILRFQEYKKGRYKFKRINTSRDIVKTVEKGEKIVFVQSKVKATVFFASGGIMLIIGLIVIMFAFVLTPDTWILGTGTASVVCGTALIVLLVLGLWYMRTSFIVLGAEGIAYKLRTRGVKGYIWEDIRMDFYNYSNIKTGSFIPSSKSIEIHIFMPNGDLIKVEPGDYTCKEISSDKYSFNKVALFMLLFTVYCDYGKNRTFVWQTRRTEEHKKKPQPLKSAMSTDMLIIDTWGEQLKEALQDYKKKNYKFGKFWTREQIQDEFLRGKIFVLRGRIGIGSWIMILIPLIVPIIVISGVYERFNLNEVLSLMGLTFIIWFSLVSTFFLTLRRFLVISSSGIYYRQFIKKYLFSWGKISKIEGITKESYPNLAKDFALVKIYLMNGKKIKFASNSYKNKEFSRKVYVEMFFNLFDINSKLSKSSLHVFDLFRRRQRNEERERE